MKVIIVSDALPEPFEMDSDDPRPGDIYPFDYRVGEKVKAVLEVEGMKDQNDKHGLFHHGR